MKILSIETSCDETAIALLECSGGLTRPSFRIVKDALASQIAVHRPFGGVVPNLAKLEHQKNLPILFKKLFPNPHDLHADLVAVTSGPGLEPALWTGIAFAKSLWQSVKARLPDIKIVGANHLEGHLYSFLLAQKTGKSKYQISNVKKLFPAIGLIASGGHTTLLLLQNLTTRKKLGETRDDAVGEAFDKVARILGLPYPGGPEIEKIAPRGNARAISFPQPMRDHKNYDFSFSGLKTAAWYYLRDHPRAKKADVAASFQAAATDVLVHKTLRAVREYGARSILLSGGAAANKSLRKKLARGAQEHGSKFLAAEFRYNTDNAVMIGVAAYINFLQNKKYPLVANGLLNIR
jgi:N6-L-threonylcarbamoyladenine synthase